MKLVQALALQLQISRRKASCLIDEGLVKVNGQTCLQYSLLVDPKADRIEFVSEKAGLSSMSSEGGIPLDVFTCVAFHKPRGMICSMNGAKNALNAVLDNINIASLKPVGRLDTESEGLLLLSNDGALIHRLTHPKHHVEKVYMVWASGYKNSKQIDHLKGLLETKVLQTMGQSVMFEIRLREGQNRQIRRACAGAGLFVERILRIAIGTVKLGKLQSGQWKLLNTDEIMELIRESEKC